MKRDPGPDPMRQFLVSIALLGALYMAIAGLMYQATIASLLPPNADMSWSTAFSSQSGGAPAQPQVRRYVK